MFHENWKIRFATEILAHHLNKVRKNLELFYLSLLKQYGQTFKSSLTFCLQCLHTFVLVAVWLLLVDFIDEGADDL